MRYFDNGFGLHPKTRFTSSNNRFYTMDNDTANSPSICNGGTLTAYTGTVTVEDAIIGRGRRLGGGALRSETLTVGKQGAFTSGNWTLSGWVRPYYRPATNYAWVMGAVGDLSSSTAANNMLFGAGFFPDNSLQIAWQHGSGTQIGFIDTGVKLLLDEWYYLCFTGEWQSGGGGTYIIKTYVNGKLMHTNTNSQRPTGGSSSRFYLGDTEGVSRWFACDFAGLYFWDRTYEPAHILEDARRGLCLDEKVSSKAQVQIESEFDGDGKKFYIMNDFANKNWVQSCTFSDSVDDDFQVGTLTLHKDIEKFSLAYAMESSPANKFDMLDTSTYRPFIDVSNGVRVLTCRLPLMLDARDGDYRIMLDGKIEEISNGDDVVTVGFRGKGGELAHAMIETVRQYGAGYINEDGALLGNTPEAINVVAQNILDDNDDTQNGINNLPAVVGSYAPITVTSTDTLPSTSGVIRYSQQRVPVLTALKTLVSTIGWLIKFKYHHVDNAWRYTISNPIQAPSEPAFSILDQNIISVSNAAIVGEDIRNVVRVAFPSREAVNTSFSPSPSVPAGYTVTSESPSVASGGQRIPAWVQYRNNDSITRYGRRTCIITEDASSQISTRQHAYLMARAILESLEQPYYNLSIVCDFMPFVDVNNIVLLPSVDGTHDTPKTMAAISYEHTITPDGISTTMLLRGKPSSGYMRWLEQEVRPSRGQDPIDEIGRVDIMEGRNSMRDQINTVMDRFRLGGALPRPDTGVDVIPNPRFHSISRGLRQLPDGWQVRTSQLNTNIFYSAHSMNGENAIYIDNSEQPSSGSGNNITGAGLWSSLVPYPRDAARAIGLNIDWGRKDGSGDILEVGVIWYQADRQTIVPVSGNDMTVHRFGATVTGNYDAGVWQNSQIMSITPPSGGNAAFFRVVFGAVSGSGSDVIIDGMRMNFVEPKANVFQEAGLLSSVYELNVVSPSSGNALFSSCVYNKASPFTFDNENIDAYDVSSGIQIIFPTGSDAVPSSTRGGFWHEVRSSGLWEYEYSYPLILTANKTPSVQQMSKSINFAILAGAASSWNLSNSGDFYNITTTSGDYPSGITAVHVNRRADITRVRDMGSGWILNAQFSGSVRLNLNKGMSIVPMVEDRMIGSSWASSIYHMGRSSGVSYFFDAENLFEMPFFRIRKISD